MTGRGAARLLPWLALPYALLIAAWLWSQPDFTGLTHDDGVYLCSAESLRAGTGPVDGHLPPEVQNARFPALHPLLLAGAGALLDTDGMDGVHRLLALNGLYAGAALFFLLRLLARRGTSPWLAGGIAAAAFTLPAWIEHSRFALSEFPFTAALLASLWLADRYRAAPGWGRLLAVGLVAGCLPALRTIGLAWVVGLALFAAVSRGPRQALWFLLGAGLTAVPLLAWTALAGRLAPQYRDLAVIGPSYFRLLTAHLGELPWILWVNLVQFSSGLPALLLPDLEETGGTLDFSLRVAAVAAGAFLVLRTYRCRPADRWQPEQFCLPLYGGVLLIWPFPHLRFLLPVLAPVLLLLAGGLPRRLAPQIAGGLLLLVAGYNTWVDLRDQRWSPGQRFAFLGEDVNLPELRDAAAWLVERTDPEEVLASSQDPALSLLSQRPGVWGWVADLPYAERYFGRSDQWRTFYRGPPPAEALRRLYASAPRVLAQWRRLGVRHVLLLKNAGSPLAELLMRRMLLDDPATLRSFELAYETAGREVQIFRLRAGPEAP